MAKASVSTLLSLEQYAEILGANPTHFQGVVHSADPYLTAVQDIVFRYAWQDTSHAGYEEIAVAIASAEAKIAGLIGFWPAPNYITQETHVYPHNNLSGTLPEFPLYSVNNITTRYPTVHCDWKKFIKGGRRRVDEIVTEVPIVYSDEDNDGYDETATVTVTDIDTTGWVPKEVAVYRTSDTSPVERVRGLTVTLTADTATIKGNSAFFIDPAAWDSVRNGEALDGAVTENFLKEVNVYREYCCNSGEDYASLVYLWQSMSANPIDSFLSKCGIIQAYDKERSIVSLIPAVWDDSNSSWRLDTSFCGSRPPNLVQLYYQAGIDTDDQGRMQPLLARAVAALATALITKPVISQGPPENLVQFWQSTPPAGTIPFGLYTCPWGTRNGALDAYSLVRDLYPEGIGTASV